MIRAAMRTRQRIDAEDLVSYLSADYKIGANGRILAFNRVGYRGAIQYSLGFSPTCTLELF